MKHFESITNVPKIEMPVGQNICEPRDLINDENKVTKTWKAEYLPI